MCDHPDEETEAQRGQVTVLKSQSWLELKLLVDWESWTPRGEPGEAPTLAHLLYTRLLYSSPALPATSANPRLFYFGEIFAIGRVRSPDRQERDRETESEKSPPRGDGHAAITSPPFSSQDLGHTRTRARREF